MTLEYQSFFKTITGGKSPREWQVLFASKAACRNRLVPVGTGLGKTVGLAGAWFYHRVVLERPDWPRRLVWCLPMRVLVEQTLDEFREICDQYAAQCKGNEAARIPSVHAFLGGVEPGATGDSDGRSQWHLYPERNAMLVGTQDMLISRALGRGYAAGRARWPIDFGLLNSDCLWVFDEVQLMGVSAVTGSQLQAFRGMLTDSPDASMTRPSYTWWSSATLRHRWLETVDSGDIVDQAVNCSATIPAADKQLPLYAAKKPLTVETIPTKVTDAAKSIAESAIKMHGRSDDAPGRVTIVVLNRVSTAVEVAKQIRQGLRKSPSVDVKLVHSRFRGSEREAWRATIDQGGFLTKKACQSPSANRIIVATQVIEAGVDISAGPIAVGANCGGLITELAPWSSLVQRFGRAARYGGASPVLVVDRQVAKSDAAPYEESQLDAARKALSQLNDVGLDSLGEFDTKVQNDIELDEMLFTFEYNNLLNQNEFEELFDNSMDVTGDDIDISRFIREDDQTNTMLCWIETGPDSDSVKWRPPNKFTPSRLSLCPAPFIDVRDWLFDPRKAEGFRKVRNPYAFMWSYEEGRWLGVRRKEDILPGATVLVDFRIGGYESETGFAGSAASKAVDGPVSLDDVVHASMSASEHADRSQASDDLSITDSGFQSIADHGKEVGDLAEKTAGELGFPRSVTALCRLAGYWHDWGKAHPAFQGNIIHRADEWKNARDIAKAPAQAWRHYASWSFNFPELSFPDLFGELTYGKRRGFRHELATVLGLFELLARDDSRHAALRGEDTTMDELFDKPIYDRSPDDDIVSELRALTAIEFNLLTYLIAAHHGKVRCQLLMTQQDQEFRPPISTSSNADDSNSELPVRGIRSNDVLPPTKIVSKGTQREVPAVTLYTDIAAMGWSGRYGASWTERSMSIVKKVGVFDLALLEAVLRAADVRCSQAIGVDKAYAQVDEPTTSLNDEEQNTELVGEATELDSPETEVTQ